MSRGYLQAVISIARVTLLEAWRSRYGWVLALLALVAVAVAEFLGQAAVTESQILRQVVLGALLRWIAVLGCALYVISAMVREYQDKGWELVFSLDLPRGGYYAGKLAGHVLLALVPAAGFALLLGFYVPWPQAAAWGLSLWWELWIVTALCLLLACSLTQVASAFAVFLGFYLLARSIAAMELMARGPLVDLGAPSQQFMAHLVEWLALLLPDLERFTRSEWLAYGVDEARFWLPLLVQAVLYVALLSTMALFDLQRRRL